VEEQTRSLSEVAGLMGVSERTVRRWIKSGRLKAYKPGRDYRIPESGLREFIEESEVSPKEPALPSPQPSFNDALGEAQRLTYLRAWRAFIWKLLNRWQQEPPESEREITIVRDTMQALLDEGAFERPAAEITTSDWREVSDWAELELLFKGLDRLNRIADTVETNTEAERRRADFAAIRERMSA
jgi:excisionase family DNA binding protein